MSFINFPGIYSCLLILKSDHTLNRAKLVSKTDFAIWFLAKFLVARLSSKILQANSPIVYSLYINGLEDYF